jgi:hypothetical protein
MIKKLLVRAFALGAVVVSLASAAIARSGGPYVSAGFQEGIACRCPVLVGNCACVWDFPEPR